MPLSIVTCENVVICMQNRNEHEILWKLVCEDILPRTSASKKICYKKYSRKHGSYCFQSRQTSNQSNLGGGERILCMKSVRVGTTKPSSVNIVAHAVPVKPDMDLDRRSALPVKLLLFASPKRYIESVIGTTNHLSV